MKTNMQRNVMCAFAGTLGLAVLGTLAAPANAQNNNMRRQNGGMMSGDGKMMDKNASAEERRMRMLGEKFGDYKYVDPAPLNYPIAAPGTVDLYHYDSYTGDRVAEGSAHDVRMEKTMMVEKSAMNEGKMMHGRMTRGAYYDDPFTADPAPVNYPLAAPGSLDLYTFTDYTMNKLTTARFMDRKMDKEMMKDQMTPGSHMFSGQAYSDDPYTADPAPVNYPFAAPGTVDLYHFRTYRMNQLEPGSAHDVRMERQMMKDNMTPGSRNMKSDKMKK